MPIVPVPATTPSVTTVPHIVPPGQKVVPVEPSRRVTAGKHGGRGDLDPDERRRRHGDQDGRRGANLDLDV
jgi:hypothetical protein